MSGENSYILNLTKKTNYLNKNLKYVKKSLITEYDMKSAGLNILTDKGIFSSKQRKEFLNIPKEERNILIGKFLMKNKKVINVLEDGFAEMRYKFIIDNHIDPDDILSIKKDAFFIINKYSIDENITELVKIRPKNTFSTYINILNREHYYNADTNKLIVKGYSKDIIGILEKSTFKILKDVLSYDNLNNKDQIFIDLVTFKDNLITYNLSKEYYYDFIEHGYVVKNYNNTKSYIIENVEEEERKYISYDTAFKFINELIRLIL